MRDKNYLSHVFFGFSPQFRHLLGNNAGQTSSFAYLVSVEKEEKNGKLFFITLIFIASVGRYL
jgi:hypothetical protein